MKQVITKTNKAGLLFYLIALTALFFFFEIGVFVQGSELYLGDYKYIAKHIAIPWRVIPGVAFFIFVQLSLHVLFVFSIFFITCWIGFIFEIQDKKLEMTGIVVWILALLTVLLGNQYLYPNSKFADITSQIIPTSAIEICFFICLSLFLILLLIAICGIFRKKSSAFILIVPALCASYFYSKSSPPAHSVATSEKPNIILIGIDALRPDFLGFFGDAKRTAPNLDQFLEHSAVFSESLTPLARTFPAWISILTGEYPRNNLMRTDLMDKKLFDHTKTLSSILQNAGYHTIFAMDDTRYSNIDHSLGFDEIVSPPFGFNDFLLGTMNDFPLSNLLVNTPLGRYLLPHSYANRAVFTTYNPNTFNEYLNDTLKKSHNKPVFLAVHFCLPHYPYAWSDHTFHHRSLFNYRSAIHRADQQFSDFLKILKKNQLLEHSIVVVLSDHGEALELPGDRATEADLFIPGKSSDIPHFYPGSQKEKINRSGGHGTDVLSLTQYHTVLAFRYFGVNGQKVNVIPGRVSLLDITPTILQTLNIAKTGMDGRSLASYIAGDTLKVANDEHFFIESDFSPNSVRTVHPETRKVLFQGIDYFQIDPKTTRITVKPKMLQLIISSKQYADFYGPWVLALYPQSHKPMIPILVNLETGQWTDDLSTPFAQDAPTLRMLQALKSFFKEDLTEITHFSS